MAKRHLKFFARIVILQPHQVAESVARLDESCGLDLRRLRQSEVMMTPHLLGCDLTYLGILNHCSV